MGRADASGARSLLGDDIVNSRPVWSRDGGRILFHRLAVGSDVTFTLHSVRPDGTDLQPLRSQEVGLAEYPST